jgi:hypothetical protein
MPTSNIYWASPKELNATDLHGKTLDIHSCGVGKMFCIENDGKIQLDVGIPFDATPPPFKLHMTESDIWAIQPHPLAHSGGPDFFLHLD